MSLRRLSGGLCILALLAATPAAAQIEDQLSAYTGVNAEGYLKPLADAFGADLNNGFYHSARIPNRIFIALEIPVMAVLFGDDDRTFKATTEEPFGPTTTVSNAPTVVGDGDAVFVSGNNNTQFYFPGGFNLNSFALAVPQLRFGTVKGTEGILRLLPGIDTGDAELGKINLFGIGARHSITQYISDPIFDVAAGFMYQTFKVGENNANGDLLSSSAFTVGAQASKGFEFGILMFEPYTGLSFDSFQMDVAYEGSDGSAIDLSFDRSNNVSWTIGAGLNFVAGHVFAHYAVASQSSFSFGLALGNVGM